ncbi:MAG: gephyrin-like molybdotransferase Glp [Pseudomonadota bacterium]
MITVGEARERLLTRVRSWSNAWPSETVSLSEAGGRIVAESVRAPIDVPHFDNSAMDGFAVRASETTTASKANPVRLDLAGTTQAGDLSLTLSSPRTSIQIMTGAPIPKGADAVVPKEVVREGTGWIELSDPVATGRFIRPRGGDVREGEIVASIGARVTVGLAGILASIGIRKVQVAKLPKVSVIVTGRELVMDPKDLREGKTFESNSVILGQALREIGCPVQRLERVGDDLDETIEKIGQALEESDLLLVTGGVSVGEHDVTREALARLGVEELFWRVAQKPGKPIYAGFQGKRLILALPGNPFAVFTCFYMYARPAILTLMGATDVDLRCRTVPLLSETPRSDSRAQWLKGKLVREGERWGAVPLTHQDSHLLSSLKEAEVLIFIPEGDQPIREGGRCPGIRTSVVKN